MKSVGSEKFRKAPGRGVQKAERFSVSTATISALQNGTRSPSETLRAQIEAAGDPWPSRDEWDQALPAAPPPPVRELTEVEPATPEAAAEVAAQLLAKVTDALSEIDQEPDPAKRVIMLDRASAAAGRLGQMTGTKLTPRAIMASPTWAAIERAVTEALKPWPDAMRAVAAALETL